MDSTAMQLHNRATRRESCEDVLGCLGIGNAERLNHLANDADFEAATAGIILESIRDGVFATSESQRPVFIQADILPESDMTVLICMPESDNPVSVGFHDGEAWFDYNGAPLTGRNAVNHWMMLPEPMGEL
jgi:hypothetical protein